MQNVLKPKLKSTVQLQTLEQKIYLGQSGMAFELDDPTGFISELCLLMNGEKNLDQLKALLADKYPNECQEFDKVIAALDEAAVLENADNTNYFNLSNYELSRWSRNTDFFGSFSHLNQSKFQAQARLKSVRITLLGLGGLGSHILYDLVALGVQHIRAVDFDKIEISNLNRQILYSENDIGCLKTEAAAARIKQFYSDNKIEFVQKKLTSSEDIEAVIAGSELVICVADKPKLHMQNWLNTACVKLGIPFINGGLDTRRALYCMIIPEKTGCIECWKKSVASENPIASDLLKQEEQAEINVSIPAPALVSLVSTLTGLMINDFIKWSTQVAPPLAQGCLVNFNFDTGQISIAEQWNKQTHCSVCGKI